MKETHAANEVVTRHLLEAIERVRDDVSKVEFWAGAVAGFAQPVPEYSPSEATVWLPSEQANTLRSRVREPGSTRPKSGSSRSERRKTAPSRSKPRG